MSNYQAELAELMPETSAVESQGVGVNVRRLLKLRGRFMAALFLLIVIPAAIAIWVMVPRHYVASADVEFQASAQSILLGQIAAGPGGAYDSFVNTQISLITGYTILSRVLQDEEVKNLPDIREAGQNAMQYLDAHIEAAQIPSTELVTFNMKHEDAATAQLLLNKVLDTYRVYVSERDIERGETRRRLLKEREASIMDTLEAQRTEITEMRKEQGIPISAVMGMDPAELEAARTGLSQAEEDLSGAESRVRQTESLIERVQALEAGFNASPSAPIFALGIEEKVQQDPNVVLLIEQLAAVQQEYSRLEETYVSNAPQVEVKRAELKALEDKLANVKSDARRAALGSVLGQYEYELGTHQSQLEDARERRTRFSEMISDERQGNLDRAGGMAEIEAMEKRADELSLDLRETRATINNIDIESQAPGRANILSEATVSNTADYSDRIKLLLVAAFLSFSLALLAGLVAERLDQNIRSAEDVSYVTTLPILSSILHTSEDRLPPGINVATVTEKHPDSMTADEYRRTAGQILGAARGRRQVRSCMIASPARGDGKTTLACNVALVLAQAGRKVLLLDLDSRDPSVEAQFGWKPGPGLSEILSGEDVPRDPARKSPHGNLHIMGPGLQRHTLVERLASREMEDFMAGANEVFDHIIIDTPASLLMSEPKLLAPLVDGVVLVAGAGTTTFGMFRRTLRVMKESEGEVLGVVVNAVRHSPGGYMRQNVDMYYAQPEGRERPVRARGELV